MNVNENIKNLYYHTEEEVQLVTDYFKSKQQDKTFVCESSIKDKKGEWIDYPFLIFYDEQCHPKGSHYVAIKLKYDTGSIFLIDGITATEPMAAVKGQNDQIVYSPYSHHMSITDDDTAFIDGGRHYCRTGDTPIIYIQIVKDHLEVIDVSTET